MRCTGCGEANEPDDAFCRWCGLPLPEPVLADPEDTRAARPSPPQTPKRKPRRPRRPLPRWLIPAVSAVLALAVLATAGWWFLGRPPASARSVPETLGMLPTMTQPPSRQWELTAAEVSSSCRTPGSAPAAAADRRCALSVQQWPDGSLVGTVSKGTTGRMRASEVLGVDPAQGTARWSREGLVAVCTDPHFDTVLACVDGPSSEVFALDPESGEQLWAVPFSGQADHVEEAGGDLYIFSTRDGRELLTRITTGGKEAWTVRLPQDGVQDTGRTPRPDLRTVLWDRVVYLNRVETASGASWAVEQGDGTTVALENSVVAVVASPSDGELLPVVRRPDGRLTLDGTPFIGIGGGGEIEPALHLPEAMDDRDDVPWMVVKDRGVPDPAVHAYARNHLDRELWDSQDARPVAICAGQKTMYNAAQLDLSFSAIQDLDSSYEVPTGGALGFFCDGTRTVVLDRAGISAYTASSPNPAWSVPLTGATAGEPSSLGLLVQRDSGSAVALWR